MKVSFRQTGGGDPMTTARKAFWAAVLGLITVLISALTYYLSNFSGILPSEDTPAPQPTSHSQVL